MKTRIQKWGNSLALRIPKAFASEVHLTQNSLVEIKVVAGKLVVVPVQTPSFTLEDLLAGITKKNLHREIDPGPAVGKEAW